MNTKMLESLSLSPSKKALFQQRYLNLLDDYKTRSTRYTISFHTLRIIVGVGSLLVPALLSIQQINTTGTECQQRQEMEKVLFWATWILSLLVTMSNGLFTLMKVDKKYYFIHTLLEQLRSEGWQFATLTGRYAIYRLTDTSGNLLHDPAFGLFCYMVEKIKMHQVEEEYFKLTDDYTKQQEKPAAAQPQAESEEKGGEQTGSSATVVATPKTPKVFVTAPNTEIRIQPKTPQNFLDLNGLPPEMREQMQEIIEGALNEMGVSPEVYGEYLNRQRTQTKPF